MLSNEKPRPDGISGLDRVTETSVAAAAAAMAPYFRGGSTTSAEPPRIAYVMSEASKPRQWAPAGRVRARRLSDVRTLDFGW